jgi:hypothetical protein
MSHERSFLHDISSPLTTIQLNLDQVISLLKERPSDHQELCLPKLEQCMKNVNKITDSLRKRRQAIADGEANDSER